MLHNQTQMLEQLQNPQILERILLGLLDPNEVQKATATLTDFLQNVKSCPPLLHVVCNSDNPHARNLAAVYLRSKFSSYATELGTDEEQTVCNSILTRLVQEEDLKVLRSLGQLTIKVAKIFSFGDDHKDVFQAVKAILEQNVNARTEVAITILRNLVPLTGGEPFDIYFGTFQQGLHNGSERMQLESLKGLQSLAVQSEEEINEQVKQSRMQTLTTMYKDMAAVCERFIVHEDEAIARYCVEMWSDLFLDNCLNGAETQIYNFMLQVGKKADLPINVRYQVVDYMKQYCQSRPNLFMQSKLLEPTMEFCINLLMESYEEDEDDLSCPLNIAIEVLDAVFLNVRADKTTQLALSGIQLLMKNNHEQAALSLLAIMAEGCAEILNSDENTVSGIYGLLKQGMSSSDKITRKVAYEAVTQFVYHLSPTMNRYSGELMPAIFKALEGEQNNPRNMESVCIMLDSYSSALEDNIKPHVFQIFEALFGLLRNSKQVDVQTAAISAISSSLMTTRECKVPVELEGLTEVLLQIVKTKDENLIKLKAEAITCVGEICLTVGRGSVEALNSSTDFITEIISLCGNTEEAEIRENAFQFFAHLGSLFGPDLLSFQHFPAMMKLCVDCLENEDGVVIAKPDDGFGNAGAPGIDDDDNDDLTSKFYVVTGFLEEKTSAALALQHFAQHCGPGFQECWTKVFKEVMDAMQYPHPALKQASIRAMHYLILNMVNCLKEDKCFNEKNKSEAQEYISMIVTVYLVSLAREDDKDCAVETLISLAELLKIDCQGILGLHGADPKTLTEGPDGSHQDCSWIELLEIVTLLLTEQILCQAPDDIELTEKKRETEDNPILDGITDVTTALCKGLTEVQLVDYWEKVFEELPRYLTPQRSHIEYSLAIGTMGDVSAHLSPQSIKPFLERSVQMAFAGLEASQHHLVRQNSIFALGCLCRAGGNLMKPYLEHILKYLDPICQKPRNQTDKKDQLLRDNAMSTLGSLLAFCSDDFPDQHFSNFVQIFLNGLPMEADLQENEHCARNIVRILETRMNLMQPHMQLCKSHLENSLQWGEMPQDLVRQIGAILQNVQQTQTSI